MFGFGCRKRKGECRAERRGGLLVLSDLAQEATAVVLTNGDKQTLEMGLFPGAAVRVLKSRPTNPNVIVAAGDSRLIIPRIAADKIGVKECSQRS